MTLEDIVFDPKARIAERISAYFKLGTPDISAEIKDQENLVREIAKAMSIVKEQGLELAHEKIKDIFYAEKDQLTSLKHIAEVAAIFETYEDYLDFMGR